MFQFNESARSSRSIGGGRPQGHIEGGFESGECRRVGYHPTEENVVDRVQVHARMFRESSLAPTAFRRDVDETAGKGCEAGDVGRSAGLEWAVGPSAVGRHVVAGWRFRASSHTKHLAPCRTYVLTYIVGVYVFASKSPTRGAGKWEAHNAVAGDTRCTPAHPRPTAKLPVATPIRTEATR